MNRLPIKRVITEAASNCWGLRRVLAQVMALPVLVYFALCIIRVQLYPKDSLIAVMLSCVAMMLAAVACHRVLLLGPISVPRFGLTRLSKREFNFMAAAILIWATTTVVHGVFNRLADEVGLRFEPWEPWQLVAWLPGFYLMARLSLILPAIAIDAPIRIRDLWRLSDGNGIALSILVASIPWLIRLGEWGLGQTLLPRVETFVSPLLYVLFLPLEVSLLSMSYRQLTQSRRRR